MNNYKFNSISFNTSRPFVIFVDENETYSAYILDSHTFATSKASNYETNALITSIAMILLCILGLASNFISFMIFKHKEMQSSINVLLAALSLIDLAVILLAIPVFVLPALNEYLMFEWIKDHYYFVILYLYPLAMMAQTSSIWTFILITVERFYAVCFPLNTKLHLTTKRAKITQLIVVASAILYNIVRFWEFRLIVHTEVTLQAQRNSKENDGAIPLNLRDMPTKTVHEAWPMLRQTSSAYFNYYYVGAYLLTHCAMPFLVVLALNTKIACCIRRAGRQRAAITNKVTHKDLTLVKKNTVPTASSWLLPRLSPPTVTPMLCNTTSSQTSRFNTTKMVFIVTALFFSCNAFSPILSVWEACQPDLFDQSSSSKIDDRTKSSFIEGLSFRLDTDEQSTSSVTKNISKNQIEDNNLSNKTIGGFLLVDLSNLGVLLNASTNFIIYLIYCRRYRRYFKGYLAMFRCFQYKNKFRENAAKSNSWPSEYGATKRRFKKQLNSENKPMSRVCPSLATTNGRVIKPRTVAFDKKIAVLRQRCFSVTTI